MINKEYSLKLSAIELRSITGCSLGQCEEAIIYTLNHGGDDSMSIAYLKAKHLTIKTKCDFDTRVQLFMEDSKV